MRCDAMRRGHRGGVEVIVMQLSFRQDVPSCNDLAGVFEDLKLQRSFNEGVEDNGVRALQSIHTPSSLFFRLSMSFESYCWRNGCLIRRLQTTTIHFKRSKPGILPLTQLERHPSTYLETRHARHFHNTYLM